MVVAIVAIIAVVSDREMDDRNRGLCISAVVVGTAAALLIVGLKPGIIRPTLTCLAYVLAILVIGIAAKVTDIASKMTKVVVHLRGQRQHENAVPDASLPGNGSGKPPGRSQDFDDLA